VTEFQECVGLGPRSPLPHANRTDSHTYCRKTVAVFLARAKKRSRTLEIAASPRIWLGKNRFLQSVVTNTWRRPINCNHYVRGDPESRWNALRPNNRALMPQKCGGKNIRTGLLERDTPPDSMGGGREIFPFVNMPWNQRPRLPILCLGQWGDGTFPTTPKWLIISRCRESPQVVKSW